MKKISLIIIIFVSIVFFGCDQDKLEDNKNVNVESINKLQVCPEAWYDNKMPTICDQEPCGSASQYFVINGERKELDEVDVAWVQNNCAIKKPQVVQ